MTAVAYVPPNVLPPTLQKFAGLLKRKWFRELVLAPPTVTRRRFSNKTEDYGVFQPSMISIQCRFGSWRQNARCPGEVFADAIMRPSRVATPISSARRRIASNAAASLATKEKCSIEPLSIFSL